MHQFGFVCFAVNIQNESISVSDAERYSGCLTICKTCTNRIDEGLVLPVSSFKRLDFIALGTECKVIICAGIGVDRKCKTTYTNHQCNKAQNDYGFSDSIGHHFLLINGHIHDRNSFSTSFIEGSASVAPCFDVVNAPQTFAKSKIVSGHFSPFSIWYKTPA